MSCKCVRRTVKKGGNTGYATESRVWEKLSWNMCQEVKSGMMQQRTFAWNSCVRLLLAQDLVLCHGGVVALMPLKGKRHNPSPLEEILSAKGLWNCIDWFLPILAFHGQNNWDIVFFDAKNASVFKKASAQCLKITQNVAFEFFNIGIFHQFLSSVW